MVSSLNTARSARNISYEVVQALSKTIAFNTLNIGTADKVLLGSLPSGAQITQCIVRVTAAFNAATTNVLTVGTSSGSDADIVAAADIDEGTAATTIIYTGAGLSFTADTPIYIKYTQTGTAATTGGAIITLCYVATGNE